jgi:hypothetical protein
VEHEVLQKKLDDWEDIVLLELVEKLDFEQQKLEELLERWEFSDEDELEELVEKLEQKMVDEDELLDKDVVQTKELDELLQRLNFSLEVELEVLLVILVDVET